MQNGGETPASRPTLEAFRSDVPAYRNRSRNRSHFWRRTAQLPFTEPTISSTWHDPDSLCTPSKFRKPSRTTKSTFPDRHAFNDRLLRPEWLHSSSRWAGPVGTHEISAARDRLCALDDLLNGSFAGRLQSSARAGKDDYLLQTIHNVKV